MWLMLMRLRDGLNDAVMMSDYHMESHPWPVPASTGWS